LPALTNYPWPGAAKISKQKYRPFFSPRWPDRSHPAYHFSYTRFVRYCPSRRWCDPSPSRGGHIAWSFCPGLWHGGIHVKNELRISKRTPIGVLLWSL